MVYWKVMVVVMVGWLCGSTEGMLPISQTLDSDLDSLLCSPTNYRGYIIDIHESMSKGAELLDGVLANSLATCMSGCCKTRGCDLALYKNEGVSNTGKNCYYVQCGVLDNCVLVKHSAFTSVSFLQALPKSTTVSTTPPTSAMPTVTTATPTGTTATPTVVSTSTATPTTTPPTVAPSHSTPSPTSANVTPASVSGPNSTHPSPGSQDNEATPSVDSEVKVQVGNDDCGKYGCDGSGVVAVVVVGVVCFAIVLVVVAILLKKVVDDRRKRKFRNVDYLINGMYT